MLRKFPASCHSSLTSSSGSVSRTATAALKSIIKAILPVVMTACLSKREIALVRAKIVLRACRNTCPGIGDILRGRKPAASSFLPLLALFCLTKLGFACEALALSSRAAVALCGFRTPCAYVCTVRQYHGSGSTKFSVRPGFRSRDLPTFCRNAIRFAINALARKQS